MIVNADWVITAITKDDKGIAATAYNQFARRYIIFEIGYHTSNGRAFIENAKVGSIIKSTLELQS